MRNLTLKTTLSALLVSVPLAGAFAENNREAASGLAGPALVDPVQTSSVGASTSRSYSQLLASSLNAAETNLDARDSDGFSDPAGAAQIRSEIRAIRQQAAEARQTGGGDLDDASYRALSAQVRVLHQNVLALQNGG